MAFSKFVEACTGQQWIFLILVSMIKFFSGIISSLQAPFFPKEAENHGLTATEYGLAISLFDISALITSFVFGYVSKGNRETLIFKVSPFIEGLSCILFGCTSLIQNKLIFIGIVILLRATEGLGNALYLITSIKETSRYFEEIEVPVSMQITFNSVGFSTGPFIGGLIYAGLGFMGPFYTIGGILTAIGLFNVICLDKNQKAQEEAPSIENENYKDLLKRTPVLVLLFTLLLHSLSWRLIFVGFEPHIRDFNLSATEVGLVFMIGELTYTLTIPFWAKMATTSNYMFVILLFSAVIALGFSLLGSVQILPLDKTLIIISIGYGIFGVGTSANYNFAILIFTKEVRASIAGNSLWSMVFSFGNIAGYFGGGFLIDVLTFRGASFIVVCLYIFNCILFAVLSCKSLRDEDKKLLQNK